MIWNDFMSPNGIFWLMSISRRLYSDELPKMFFMLRQTRFKGGVVGANGSLRSIETIILLGVHEAV